MASFSGADSAVISSDISQGMAKYPIRIINALDNKRDFPQFEYAVESKFDFKEDILPERQFCSCNGDCSTNKGCSCVNLGTIKMNSRQARVLDVEQLSENPFNSTFFECTANCACFAKCKHRMIPAGPSKHQMEIYRKPRMGYACRTLRPIRKGAFVCCLAGEIISNLSNMKEIPDVKNACITFQDQTRQLGFSVRMDRIANESRFFNSACCPNLVPVLVYRRWVTPNRPIVVFVARNEINAGEDLTFFYGDHWLLTSILSNNRFVCQCASPFCVWPQTRKEEIENVNALVQNIQEQMNRTDEERSRQRHVEKKAKIMGAVGRGEGGERGSSIGAPEEME